MEYVSYIERIIIQEILGAADARFHSISVFDGEEWALKKSRDYMDVKRFIGATDQTTLRFRDSEGQVIGSVLLVHGNEWDVISDYTDSSDMAALLASAHAVAERFSNFHG